MKEKPRSSNDFIVTRNMAYTIFSVAAVFFAMLIGLLFYMNANGGMTLRNMSFFFTFFVLLQWWNLFNARAFMTDKWTFSGILQERTFLLISLLIFVGQVLIVSFGGEMFSVEPLTFKDWLQITIATSSVLLVGIIAGFIRRKLFAKV